MTKTKKENYWTLSYIEDDYCPVSTLVGIYNDISILLNDVVQIQGIYEKHFRKELDFLIDYYKEESENDNTSDFSKKDYKQKLKDLEDIKNNPDKPLVWVSEKKKDTMSWLFKLHYRYFKIVCMIRTANKLSEKSLNYYLK